LDKIKELLIPDNARVIVISDIHGELELLKGLLTKVGFGQDDYLIINGDLCEKGSNSMGVVSYLMALSEKNAKVHVTEGNCDTIVEDLLDENPKLINYMLKRRSIINEWLEYLGVHVDEESDIHEIKEQLTSHFSKEIEWLMDLPTAIETDRYIFVHAGLEDIDNWRETDRMAAISMPSFLGKSHRAGKYVVVGHWPVANFTSALPINNPIIDKEKKIIAIDGGNVIRESGQLNAFIIQSSSLGDSFSHTYIDKFPEIKSLNNYSADPEMAGVVNYPLFNVVPVKQSNHFTLCKQAETNQLLHVKNEYLLQNETGQFTVKTDVSCTQLHVRKGDVVSVVDDSCTGYNLIKKEGAVGWVPKEICPIHNARILVKER
jgi:protein phosphatase